jgi:Tfp pilus assembly protein PilF/peroxiredoxin
MKPISFVIMASCLWGLFSLTPAAAALQTLQPGMEAPDFSLATLAGKKKSFEDVKGGKLTILVFWSTWSSKSEKALSRMQGLYEKYRGQGLSVVAVNADAQRVSEATLAEIRAFAENLKIGFPVLLDRGLTAFNEYGAIALPTMVVLDAERVIKYELPGYPLAGSEAMVDFVAAAIEGRRLPVAGEKAGRRPDKNALRFYDMGKTALKAKSLARTAEMWFQKAVEADPAFVLPHLSLGRIFQKRGEPALAKQEFRAALAEEPANPIALCEYGMNLAGEGKRAEGIALFEAARKAEESYAPCYYYAGYAYGKEGRLQEAVGMFDEAESVNPMDYRTFVFRGMFYEDQKEHSRAFHAYKRALEVILHAE